MIALAWYMIRTRGRETVRVTEVEGHARTTESVFPCLVTRFANSPNSSLRVSSHARARALCFAAASAFLSDPHSALHSLAPLTDALADDSLKCFV